MGIAVNLLLLLLRIIELAILARCILSFLPGLHQNAIVQVLFRLTEPVLSPIRMIVEKVTAGKNIGLDFSPLIAYFIIYLARMLLEVLFYRI